MKTKFAIAHLGSILFVILACIVATTQVTHAQESAPVEGWPRLYESEGNKFIVYQPQIQSWENHKIMKVVPALGDEAGAGHDEGKTKKNEEN